MTNNIIIQYFYGVKSYFIISQKNFLSNLAEFVSILSFFKLFCYILSN